MFEGGYLNGERNGKGKEFYEDNGRLKFEGEYSNGKKLKGKEYNEKRQIIYKGEYFNGKKWNGKGIEYGFPDLLQCEINNSILKFEYEYLDGEINGKVKEYKLGHLIFEGEYSIGKRHGKGKEYYNNGKIQFEYI